MGSMWLQREETEIPGPEEQVDLHVRDVTTRKTDGVTGEPAATKDRGGP